jgi:hypothetical protein
MCTIIRWIRSKRMTSVEHAHGRQEGSNLTIYGALSFLRSRQSLSYSRVSKHFMELEVSQPFRRKKVGCGKPVNWRFG